MKSYTPIYSHETDVYNLEGFSPQVVDSSYLESLGVNVTPDQETLKALETEQQKRNGKLFWKPRRKTSLPEMIWNGKPRKEEPNYKGQNAACRTRRKILTARLNPWNARNKVFRPEMSS